MKKRLESLDFIRAAACLAVIATHMHITDLGYVAVTVFFVLSSFLLTYNRLGGEGSLRSGFRDCVLFGINRTKKLYPLYVITLIVPMLIQLFGIFSGLGVFDAGFVLRTLAGLTLVQSLVPDMETYFFLNGVAWHLSTSLFLYMIYPLILQRTERRAGVKGAWCAIITTTAVHGALALLIPELAASRFALDPVEKLGFSEWLVYISPFSRVADFIIGCNAAYIFVNRREKKRSAAAASALELLALLCTVIPALGAVIRQIPENLRFSTVFFPGSMFVIMVFARGEGYISRFLTNRAVSFISDLSPYLFLIHPVVIMVFTVIINRLPLPFRLLQFVYLFTIPTVSILLAMLYRKYEAAGALRSGKAT